MSMRPVLTVASVVLLCLASPHDSGAAGRFDTKLTP